jgi:hypothetical protein
VERFRDVIEPMLEGVLGESCWKAEGDAEDLADGAGVFCTVQAAERGVMLWGAFGECFIDPVKDCVGFRGPGARFPFWRHFIGGQHAVDLLEEAGRFWRCEVEGGEVEIYISFGFIGIVATCAVRGKGFTHDRWDGLREGFCEDW